jgi:hypothetical protein
MKKKKLLKKYKKLKKELKEKKKEVKTLHHLWESKFEYDEYNDKQEEIDALKKQLLEEKTRYFKNQEETKRKDTKINKLKQLLESRLGRDDGKDLHVPCTTCKNLSSDPNGYCCLRGVSYLSVEDSFLCTSYE